MSGLRLNQVTLGAIDFAASVLFYKKLGLTLIVDSAPRYARFEFPSPPTGGEPATLSLHGVEPDWKAPTDWPLIYFEVDDVVEFLTKCELHPITKPEMKDYQWFEADILDPSGNRIRLYSAGDFRLYPPWRVL